MESDINEDWLKTKLQTSDIFIQNQWLIRKLRLDENISNGHGFISDILPLTVEIETSDHCTVTKHLVVKKPGQDEMMKQFDLIAGYSKREALMYYHFLTDIDEYARKKKIPQQLTCQRPICWAVNLKDPTAIIMDDLRSQDYQMVGFHMGLDYQHAIVAVQALATFHAYGIAYRISLGETDYTKRYPFLYQADPNDPLVLSLLPKCFRMLLEHIRSLPGHEDLAIWLEKHTPTLQAIINLLTPRLPLATITHADASSNNIMFLYDSNRSVPLQAKLLDFQVCMYGRPTNDLAFLLFSSLVPEVRRKNSTSLAQEYLKTLTETLDQCREHINLDLVRDAFWEEWKSSQLSAFYHLVLCGQNWFFGRYATDSVKDRLVQVAQDVAKLFP